VSRRVQQTADSLAVAKAQEGTRAAVSQRETVAALRAWLHEGAGAVGVSAGPP